MNQKYIDDLFNQIHADIEGQLRGMQAEHQKSQQYTNALDMKKIGDTWMLPVQTCKPKQDIVEKDPSSRLGRGAMYAGIAIAAYELYGQSR